MTETPRHKNTAAEIGKGIVLLIGVGIVVSVVGARRGSAEPEVISKEMREDARLIDGEPDYGLVIAARVKNNAGKGGRVRVRVALSTSEGEWDRTQTIVFKPNETRELEYFFQEPTINADNIQATVDASKPWF